jgi:hypothetical protein
MATQIWQHVASGEKFVVNTDDKGAVVAAAGPLHYSEIVSVLEEGFDSEEELVDDLNADIWAYRDVTAAARQHVAHA